MSREQQLPASAASAKPASRDEALRSRTEDQNASTATDTGASMSHRTAMRHAAPNAAVSLQGDPATTRVDMVSRLGNQAMASMMASRDEADASDVAADANALAQEKIAQSGGQALPSELASRMTAALGVDVSHTTIHTDAAAAEAAENLNAHAFAMGSDIYFAQGMYQPGTPAGDELIAHELTHVVQDMQGRLPGATGPGLSVSSPTDTHEQEAYDIGARAAQALHGGRQPMGLLGNGKQSVSGGSGGTGASRMVSRDAAGDIENAQGDIEDARADYEETKATVEETKETVEEGAKEAQRIWKIMLPYIKGEKEFREDYALYEEAGPVSLAPDQVDQWKGKDLLPNIPLVDPHLYAKWGLKNINATDIRAESTDPETADFKANINASATIEGGIELLVGKEWQSENGKYTFFAGAKGRVGLAVDAGQITLPIHKTQKNGKWSGDGFRLDLTGLTGKVIGQAEAGLYVRWTNRKGKEREIGGTPFKIPKDPTLLEGQLLDITIDNTGDKFKILIGEETLKQRLAPIKESIVEWWEERPRLLQRKAEEADAAEAAEEGATEEGTAETASRDATSNAAVSASAAESAQGLMRQSSGQALGGETAARMSEVLGADVSGAAVHTDAAAAQAASQLNAKAFAVGSDVYFGAGNFQPGSRAGDELLAHELAHTVQASEGRLPGAAAAGLNVSSPSQAHEQEAYDIGARAAAALHDGSGATNLMNTDTAVSAAGAGSTASRMVSRDAEGASDTESDSAPSVELDPVAALSSGNSITLGSSIAVEIPIAGSDDKKFALTLEYEGKLQASAPWLVVGTAKISAKLGDTAEFKFEFDEEGFDLGEFGINAGLLQLRQAIKDGVPKLSVGFGKPGVAGGMLHFTADPENPRFQLDLYLDIFKVLFGSKFEELNASLRNYEPFADQDKEESNFEAMQRMKEATLDLSAMYTQSMQCGAGGDIHLESQKLALEAALLLGGENAVGGGASASIETNYGGGEDGNEFTTTKGEVGAFLVIKIGGFPYKKAISKEYETVGTYLETHEAGEDLAAACLKAAYMAALQQRSSYTGQGNNAQTAAVRIVERELARLYPQACAELEAEHKITIGTKRADFGVYYVAGGAPKGDTTTNYELTDNWSRIGHQVIREHEASRIVHEDIIFDGYAPISGPYAVTFGEQTYTITFSSDDSGLVGTWPNGILYATQDVNVLQIDWYEGDTEGSCQLQIQDQGARLAGARTTDTQEAPWIMTRGGGGGGGGGSGETASRDATSNAAVSASAADSAQGLMRQSSGQALGGETAARMSQVLGTDVSGAAVHTDAAAAQAASQLNAKAFAVGSDVYFGAGNFQPGSRAGDELLAHELAHTVQASEGRLPGAAAAGLNVSSPSQAHEQEAYDIGARAAAALHDGSGATNLMNTDTAVSAAGAGSTASRMVSRDAEEDEDVDGQYGLGAKTDYDDLAMSLPGDLFTLCKEIEADYYEGPHANIGSSNAMLAEAAKEAASICQDLFILIDQISADTAASEASDGTSGTMTADDIADIDEAAHRADAALGWYGCHEELVGLSYVKLAIEYGPALAALSAEGEIQLHAQRVERAGAKCQEAHDALDSFWKDAILKVIETQGEKFVKDKLKDVAITTLLTALLGPVGAGPAIIKGATFVTKELVDMAGSANKPEEKPKPSKVLDDAEKWVSKPKDILEIIHDSEKLPLLSTELHTAIDTTLDKSSKVMKTLVMAMEAHETIKEEWVKVNEKLKKAAAAMAEVEAATPAALAKYHKLMGMADRLAATAPDAIAKYNAVRSDMFEFEVIMYGG